MWSTKFGFSSPKVNFWNSIWVEKQPWEAAGDPGPILAFALKVSLLKSPTKPRVLCFPVARHGSKERPMQF